MPVRFALRRLPLAALLALALGSSTTFQALLAQAQDGGGQTFAAYDLIIQSTGLDRFCVGQRTAIPLKIQANVLVAGGPAAGAVRVGNVTTQVTSQNFNIATGELRQGWQGGLPDVPYESALVITGVAVGTTTITVDIGSQETNRFGSASAFQLRKTLPVRVVPCQYRVNVTSFWLTRMYSADVLISATMVNIPLASATGLTFSNDLGLVNATSMQWNFTTNRLKGCNTGNDSFRERGVIIDGLILDDELSVTVTIPELPSSTNLYIQCHRSFPEDHRIRSCDEYPDKTCHPANEGGRDSFSPESVEIKVPIDGGTRTVDHLLNHSQGSAVGRTTITITPVRP